MQAGDHMVAASTLYGGTYTQFDVSFRRFGFDVTFVSPDDPQNFAKAITPKTKLVYGRDHQQPARQCTGHRLQWRDIAHAKNVPLMIDNTFATPYLCRPIDHGADIVVHSLTKFIGGHGTSNGGMIVDSGKFPWESGNFPMLNDPAPAYHGMKFRETFGPIAYIIKCRVEGLRDLGPAISPFNSFLFLQGVETLGMRMDRHVSNALAAAQFLERHPLVEWVRYPSLASSPYHAMAQKYVPKGAGSVFSFGLKTGYEGGRRFIDALQMFSHLATSGTRGVW
jgi:O-acetylhomoserine (thiol)-lyase